MKNKRARYSVETGGEAIINKSSFPRDTPRPVSSAKIPGSGEPSTLMPPIQTKGLEPGNADQPHTSAVGSEHPLIQTQDPAATSCCCNVVIAEEGFSEGPDHDPAEWYRRCPVHEKDKNEPWLVDTLGELRDIRGILTPAGIKFMNELRRESDRQNPYIPELERVKGGIEAADEFLAWCAHAREKEEEWLQEDSASRASKGIAIPYPEWLRKYSHENRRAMETKRDELFNEKLEIQQKIVKWRYQIPNKEGINLETDTKKGKRAPTRSPDSNSI